MDGLVYSPKEKIPLFKLMYDCTGERKVELLNNRNGRTELLKVSSLIVFILNKESTFIKNTVINNPECKQKKPICSPEKEIPMGHLILDYGTVYIEIKYKRRFEKLTIASYVRLLLEAEVLKAS